MNRSYIYWYTVPEFATELNKDQSTIRRWVYSGFIVSLGHQIRRDETGHWYIGVNKSIHFPSELVQSVHQ